MSREQYDVSTLGQFVGQELGVSDWLTVDQGRINEFADCTGDHQWIHVDVERARRESPLGSTIAHGFLTLSLLAAMQMELGIVPEGISQALNYGLNRVRFIAPVKAGHASAIEWCCWQRNRRTRGVFYSHFRTRSRLKTRKSQP
jgi:acyl dehydratase